MFVQVERTDKSSVGKQKEQSNKLNKGRRRCKRRVSKWIAVRKAILSAYQFSVPHHSMYRFFAPGVRMEKGDKAGAGVEDQCPNPEHSYAHVLPKPPDGETIIKAPTKPALRKPQPLRYQQRKTSEICVGLTSQRYLLIPFL